MLEIITLILDSISLFIKLFGILLSTLKIIWLIITAINLRETSMIIRYVLTSKATTYMYAIFNLIDLTLNLQFNRFRGSTNFDRGYCFFCSYLIQKNSSRILL